MIMVSQMKISWLVGKMVSKMIVTSVEFVASSHTIQPAEGQFGGRHCHLGGRVEE